MIELSDFAPSSVIAGGVALPSRGGGDGGVGVLLASFLVVSLVVVAPLKKVDLLLLDIFVSAHGSKKVSSSMILAKIVT